MRRTALLLLAAMASVGCLLGGYFVLWSSASPALPPEPTPNPEPAPWYFLGLADVLVAHAGQWPPLARVLVLTASGLALVTAFLRLDRRAWRGTVSAAAAWLGAALLLASWAALMPNPSRPWYFAPAGMGAGAALSLALLPLGGWAGWAQLGRDAVFSAVFGLAVALALVPLVV